MSTMITSQVRKEWAEATLRHDEGETFKVFYDHFREVTPSLTHDDAEATVLAFKMSSRALRIFAEKAPAQLRAMMVRMIGETAGEVLKEGVAGSVLH